MEEYNQSSSPCSLWVKPPERCLPPEVLAGWQPSVSCRRLSKTLSPPFSQEDEQPCCMRPKTPGRTSSSITEEVREEHIFCRFVTRAFSHIFNTRWNTRFFFFHCCLIQENLDSPALPVHVLFTPRIPRLQADYNVPSLRERTWCILHTHTEADRIFPFMFHSNVCCLCLLLCI